MAPAIRPDDERRRNLTTLGTNELEALLGPAEAQYGEQALALSISGDAGPLACGATIVDQSADDLVPEPGSVGFSLLWNDLAGETGYRVQADLDSATFVVEDLDEERPPDVAGFAVAASILPATATFRLLGHVGHAPGHGATPIGGDVVSNECAVTLVAAPAD